MQLKELGIHGNVYMGVSGVSDQIGQKLHAHQLPHETFSWACRGLPALGWIKFVHRVSPSA